MPTGPQERTRTCVHWPLFGQLARVEVGSPVVRLLAILMVVALGGVTACGGTQKAHPSSRPQTQRCRFLSTGKGWYLRSSRNVGCGSARNLIERFFAGCVAAQEHYGEAFSLRGYRCTETYRPFDAGYIVCKKPNRLVTALSVQ